MDTLTQDYVRTAHAKALSLIKVLRKHVIKNSLNPVITAVSGWFASLLSGAVFVEYIFAWNGIGKEIVDAIINSKLKSDMPYLKLLKNYKQQIIVLWNK